MKHTLRKFVNILNVNCFLLSTHFSDESIPVFIIYNPIRTTEVCSERTSWNVCHPTAEKVAPLCMVEGRVSTEMLCVCKKTINCWDQRGQ